MNIVLSNYSDHNCGEFADIIIFFNRGQSVHLSETNIDVIKILGFIKRNLSCNGYAVIGNAFTFPS